LIFNTKTSLGQTAAQTFEDLVNVVHKHLVCQNASAYLARRRGAQNCFCQLSRLQLLQKKTPPLPATSQLPRQKMDQTDPLGPKRKVCVKITNYYFSGTPTGFHKTLQPFGANALSHAILL